MTPAEFKIWTDAIIAKPNHDRECLVIDLARQMIRELQERGVSIDLELDSGHIWDVIHTGVIANGQPKKIVDNFKKDMRDRGFGNSVDAMEATGWL